MLDVLSEVCEQAEPDTHSTAEQTLATSLTSPSAEKIAASRRKRRIQTGYLGYMFSHIYVSVFVHMCVVPSGVSPGGLCPDGKRRTLVGKWSGGVRGSWAVGRGSNGSRNRPCSTAPGSLIIVSAANVFGVRE